MGIPYSREIENAFNQVTPLVAAIKIIFILLAVIQVLICVFLSAILFALIGLICTVNPDLVRERDQLVTPTVRWLSGWVFLVPFWQGSRAGASAPGTPEEDKGDGIEAGSK